MTVEAVMGGTMTVKVVVEAMCTVLLPKSIT